MTDTLAPLLTLSEAGLRDGHVIVAATKYQQSKATVGWNLAVESCLLDELHWFMRNGRALLDELDAQRAARATAEAELTMARVQLGTFHHVEQRAEQAEAERDRLREQVRALSEWHVEREIPPDSGWYLVFDGRYYGVSYWAAGRPAMWHLTGPVAPVITHWLPLPAPPTEDR